MECALDSESEGIVLPLANHRVHVVTSDKTVTFDVFSRLNKGCGPVTRYLSCQLADCSLSYPAPENGESIAKRVSCNEKACQTKAFASLIAQVVASDKPMVVDFLQENMDTGRQHKATLRISLGFLNIGLPMTCNTGTCISFQDPNEEGTGEVSPGLARRLPPPPTPYQLDAGTKASLLGLGLPALVAVLLGGLSVVLQRKTGKGEKKDPANTRGSARLSEDKPLVAETRSAQSTPDHDVDTDGWDPPHLTLHLNVDEPHLGPDITSIKEEEAPTEQSERSQDDLETAQPIPRHRGGGIYGSNVSAGVVVDAGGGPAIEHTVIALGAPLAFGDEDNDRSTPEEGTQAIVKGGERAGSVKAPRRRGDGVGLVWSGVCVSVPGRSEGACRRGKRKHIVNDVSGHVDPGQVLALIGPSGAGKSSLLKVLAGRMAPGTTSKGEILLHDGTSCLADGVAQVRAACGFVPQHCDLPPEQTTREALLFSALLRTEKGQSHRAAGTVQQVMDALRLSHVADQRIGSPLASGGTGGLSGGERRRVVLGLELVVRAQLLILDEPLSGLDSNTANSLVSLFLRLSQHGLSPPSTTLAPATVRPVSARMSSLLPLPTVRSAIVFSAHQLPEQRLDSLSAVLVLTAAGRLAFSGPGSLLRAHVEAIGFRIPPREAPAEVLLALASQRSLPALDHLHSAFRQSEQGAVSREHVARLLSCRKADTTPRRPMRSCLVQLGLLTRRQARRVARHPTDWISHWVVGAVVGVLLGLVYYQLDDRIPGMQNRLGLLFLLLVFGSLTAISALPTLQSGQTQFRREYLSSYYGVFPYMVLVWLWDLLALRVMPSVLLAFPAYWLPGLRPEGPHWLTFVLVLCLANCISAALCLAISAVAKSTAQASLLAVVLLIACLLFGGLLTSQDGSKLVSGISRFSFVALAYEALAANELSGLPLIFDPKGLGEFKVDGNMVVTNFGMEPDRGPEDILRLWIVLLFLSLLGVLIFAARTWFAVAGHRLAYTHTAELDHPCDEPESPKRKHH